MSTDAQRVLDGISPAACTQIDIELIEEQMALVDKLKRINHEFCVAIREWHRTQMIEARARAFNGMMSVGDHRADWNAMADEHLKWIQAMNTSVDPSLD